MRIKLMILALFLTSTACVTSGTISQPVTSRLKVTNYETRQIVHVTAENLNLRDAPEEHGGDVIAVMPNGAEYILYSCTTVGQTQWAYGGYVTKGGIATGWAAVRYLSDVCKR